MLDLFKIEDPNIEILDFKRKLVNDEYRNIVSARLSAPVKKCVFCKATNVIKNGGKTVHIRLADLRLERCELALWKQRYYCQECHKTWIAKTNLVEEKHSLSHQLKHSILSLAHENVTATHIARVCHCSVSSVIRVINAFVTPKRRMAILPKHLCFDEFRATGNEMAFICCDAENEHEVVTILPNRLTKTITEHFLNRYSFQERQRVETIVVDLNAQYLSFIHRIFPNAEIIIDRFHIVQMAGRALDNARIQLLKQFEDKRCREYKVLKSQWRLFHKDESQLETAKPVFLLGLNETITQNNAVDLILHNYSQFEAVYSTYQGIISALKKKNYEDLTDIINSYHSTHPAMDQTIFSLKKHCHYVANSAKYSYSNGPLEGINRKIKCLKRICCGFRNFENFLRRIDCIHC